MVLVRPWAIAAIAKNTVHPEPVEGIFAQILRLLRASFDRLRTNGNIHFAWDKKLK
jgi:hypothetical protein